MKVLITGGCGFIGTHACLAYLTKGWHTIAYDNLTKYELARTGYATDETRDFNQSLLRRSGVEVVKADVRDKEALQKAADGCDYIIHTAAQPAMTISWEDPDLDFSTNVIGTYNVLSVARRLQVPVVFTSSIHVYGNRINDTLREGAKRYEREPAEIDESHPTVEGTITPLHASKRSAELYVQTFIDTYQVKAATFRLTGMYGPYQFGGEDHGWVANFAIRATLGRPLTVFGTGKQVRDIVYASDVVAAFEAFYERQVPGVYNIGGGRSTATSLLEAIDTIGDVLGRRPDVNFAADRHGDLRYFVCNVDRARRDLGWAPTVSPRQGIERLLDWIGGNRQLFGSQ